MKSLILITTLGLASTLVAEQVNETFSLGLFSQNVVREDTAVSQLQRVITYQPGKATKIGGQPVRFSINPLSKFIDDAGLPERSTSFAFTTLFPSIKF